MGDMIINGNTATRKWYGCNVVCTSDADCAGYACLQMTFGSPIKMCVNARCPTEISTTTGNGSRGSSEESVEPSTRIDVNRSCNCESEETVDESFDLAQFTITQGSRIIKGKEGETKDKKMIDNRNFLLYKYIVTDDPTVVHVQAKIYDSDSSHINQIRDATCGPLGFTVGGQGSPSNSVPTIIDLVKLILDNFDSKNPKDKAADINGDGVVDVGDMRALINSYRK